LFGRAAAALALLGLPVALPAKAPQQARPALWSVSDADTTIYLFGTIHLLPEKADWRSDAFNRAVDGSQELIVETKVDDKDPTKILGALASLAFSKGLPPLKDRVPKDKQAALEAAVKRSGFPPAALDQMETWAVAVMLLGGQFNELDLKVDQGVEMVLKSEFDGRGKSVGELETNVEQFSFFDRLSEKSQRELLDGAIEPGKEVREEFSAMIRAWSSGDVKTIGKAFNRDLASSPELAQTLIFQRNANWAKWIEQRMAKPGTVMVAVGAGHLAGDKSVIDLLQRQGVTVHRIQ
jgi:uncharacterized protein YbaP (TraB family)